MARKLLLFFLLLVEISVLQALANTINPSEKNPFGVKSQTGPEQLVVVSTIANQPATIEAETESVSETESESSGDEEDSRVALAPATRRLGKHHSDKSVAGGGVIIGGLVTAIFAAVFCYIRVTRKRDNLVGH